MSDSDINNKEIKTLMSASSEPDLHININGVSFNLHKEILAKRSSKVRLLLKQNKINDLSLFLRDLEVDSETFEIVVTFCYDKEIKLLSSNVVSVLCIAFYLGMNEEQSKNNLLRKASEFLEQRVLPSWNETVIALRSGDKNLDKLADVGLVDIFFDSLINKASYDPRLLGEMIKNEDEFRPNPRRRLLVIDWKSEDLITIPSRFYEPLMIRAVQSRYIPVEYIVLSVCKYAEKWVFEGEESCSETRREAIEMVERLLPDQRGLISCEFLFESLKHSILLQASFECRNGFEIRISKQLDMAQATDLKIITRGYGDKAESFEDIDLVQTIVTSFYSNYDDEESEDVTPFVKVAKLLEEFLLLSASEACLKLEAFVALANIAVAISQGILRYSDGIYRAIDVYLESHGYLTETEKMEVCKVLDCSKLSQEGCEGAAKNHRLPLRIVVQILFASQLHIREEIRGKEEEVEEEEEEEDKEEEIEVLSDEDDVEKMNNKLLGLKIERHQCVLHPWKKKKKKKSVWRDMKRKFGCLPSSSSSSAVDTCTCDDNKKKKSKICQLYKKF